MSFEKLFLALSYVSKIKCSTVTFPSEFCYDIFMFLCTYFIIFSMRIILLIWNSEAVVRICSIKNVFLKISEHSQKKCLCRSLPFKKLIKEFIKKVFRHKCFPLNFEKFFRTPFLWNSCKRLLGNILIRDYFLTDYFFIE